MQQDVDLSGCQRATVRLEQQPARLAGMDLPEWAMPSMHGARLAATVLTPQDQSCLLSQAVQTLYVLNAQLEGRLTHPASSAQCTAGRCHCRRGREVGLCSTQP